MRAEDLFEQAPLGITIFRGPEFVVEMANEVYLQIVDRTSDYFVGKPLFEVLPEVRPAVEPLLNEVYSKGIPYYGTEFEVTLNRHGKRETTWFNFVYQPLREGDLVTGIMVVANEVTEQVRRKKFLEMSERKLRGLIDQSPIAMCLIRGPHYIIEMANKAILDGIWRRSAEGTTGRKLLEIFPELKGQRFPELLEQVIQTGRAHNEKEAMGYLEGSEGRRTFYLDFEYTPIFDATGGVDGIVVTINDVTERVETRRKVEEAEERARLATEASLAGVFDIELPSGKINCSRRFYEIFGLPLTGTHEDVLARVHPEDVAMRDKAWETSLRTGVLYYEIRIFTTEKGMRWIRAHGRLYRDEKGEPVRMLGTIIDETEQKMFEEELEQKVQERTRELQAANAELALRNQELLSFSYISSHDLQEPLRKIQTFASRIQSTEEGLSPENRVYFQRMQQSAKQMQMLIRDLLEYSRAGEAEKVFEPVDLGVVVSGIRQQLLEGMEGMARPVGMEAAARPEIIVGAMPVVSGIEFQLVQLFSNLLSNAVKFSRKREKAVIRVEAAKEPGFHVIRVSDNGIGFAAEYKDHIFEVFRRLHHKTEYEGTGIGLAICKKIVENHGGSISAESQPGEGAVFTVRLRA